MPYCPKCGEEYRVDLTKCPDCGLDLVDDPAAKEEKSSDVDLKAVLLCQTNDIMNAEILEQALKDHNIPHLVKSSAGTYSGFGSISQVMKGISIFVSEAAIDKAIEIAQTIIPDFELPDEKK
ncbi:MAG: hypothetical protein GY839_00665 [candidate division Zixibacteria bacterium]|nr:hypothetical protein [candidate division Zixibacteria bacterium]